MEAFKSLLDILDALPERIPDETPLADVIPGVWPTVGDLRQLIGEMPSEELTAAERATLKSQTP